MRKQLNLLLVAVAISAFTTGQGLGALPKYEIIDLGTLGGPYSYARAINDLGQVVGISARNFLPSDDDHAFLWDSAHGMIDLGALSINGCSSALAINNYGVVVGSAGSSSDAGWPFIWDPTNGMRRLDISGEGGAYGINDAGQVVGCVAWQAPYAFLVESDSTVIDLGTLGGRASFATAINNAGQVVGIADTPSTVDHAFIWDNINGMRDLGTLGGSYSTAHGINDAGQVVGYSKDALGDAHAFLWDSINGMIDLGHGPGSAINNAGQVVGGPFYWDSLNGVIRLDELLSVSSGWRQLGAEGINNQGQIVGDGITDSGKTHAFLMTPVPEPAIEAEIDIDPDTLNLSSKGKWISCYIWLPEDYDVADVNSSSILLEDKIEPQWLWCDEEEQVVVARFSRSEVQGILNIGDVELTITGELTGGTVFEGTDVIRVIDKASRK